MSSLTMPSRLPCAIRPLIVLAPTSMPSIILPIFRSFRSFRSCRRHLARRTFGREIELHSPLATWFRRVEIAFDYTICKAVSWGDLGLGTRPTTCRSERVLVARCYRGWITHMIIRTARLTIVCSWLLRGVWVAVVDVIWWCVDEACWMAGFKGS
jgi:hypothetical protein